eukprot:g382.t1
MMRIAWSRLRKPQDAEGLQVSAKFHEALVNLMKTGCRLMALALFLRLIAIQGPLLMQKEHQLQPSLDISNMISYPLCCLIVLCPKVLTPRTLDSWYLVMQTLCVFPLLFTEPQDVVNVSLITAFPRMLCGHSSDECALMSTNEGRTGSLQERLSAHFILLRHGRAMRGDEAQELWGAVRDSGVLAPFWEQYPSAVQGSLLPHHAMAVASACRWAQTNLSCLGPRGLASMALALSRLGPGLGGEEANARLLTQLLGRAQELLDESHGTKPFFRADWLGMFLSALARARCRTELKTLEELLTLDRRPTARTKVHFKRQILAGEAQNLSLCAHAVLKLDLLQVAGIAPLESCERPCVEVRERGPFACWPMRMAVPWCCCREADGGFSIG